MHDDDHDEYCFDGCDVDDKSTSKAKPHVVVTNGFCLLLLPRINITLTIYTARTSNFSKQSGKNIFQNLTFIFPEYV